MAQNAVAQTQQTVTPTEQVTQAQTQPIAQARAEALRLGCEKQGIPWEPEQAASPNNILALEYLKVLRRRNSAISFWKARPRTALPRPLMSFQGRQSPARTVCESEVRQEEI